MGHLHQGHPPGRPADRAEPVTDRDPLTPAIFTLLVALHRGQRHGYALISEVSELTGDAVRLGPGTLYRSLQRMRVEGWIEELDLDPTPQLDDANDRRAERRRSYRLTPAGRAAAQAEARRLARLLTAAQSVGLLSAPTGSDQEGRS